MSGGVLIMAGGTGGHIFPGLAVAEALRARSVPVSWLGAVGGMEARLVPPTGIPFHAVAASRFRGQGLGALLLAPFRLARSVAQSARVIRQVAPGAVLSMGGFVAAPGGVAAWLLRRPLVVHEQNRVPGLTNRILARRARRVLTGFPGTFPELQEHPVGNPVRADIAALPPPRERLAGRAGPLRLLVLGGSQGARSLNRLVPAAMAALAPGARPRLRHQVGSAGLDEARERYAAAGVEAELLPFIDDMAGAYGWADLVVARAGALTVAELCAAGVASILLPFPHAVDDHQTRNAEVLSAAGAGVICPEPGLVPAELSRQIARLAADRDLLLAMAEKARGLARPRAAEAAAALCLEACA